MEIKAGDQIISALRAWYRTTGRPYGIGGDEVRLGILDQSVEGGLWWDGAGWVAEQPAISGKPIAARIGWDYQFVVPGFATTGLAGHEIKIWLQTTNDSDQEVITSEPKLVQVSPAAVRCLDEIQNTTYGLAALWAILRANGVAAQESNPNQPTELVPNFNPKQSWEAYYLEFDFTDLLGVEEVESAVVTITDGATDVTASMTDSNLMQVGGAIVQFWIGGGEHGTAYRITCRVVGANGTAREKDATILVWDV